MENCNCTVIPFINKTISIAQIFIDEIPEDPTEVSLEIICLPYISTEMIERLRILFVDILSVLPIEVIEKRYEEKKEIIHFRMSVKGLKCIYSSRATVPIHGAHENALCNILKDLKQEMILAGKEEIKHF